MSKNQLALENLFVMLAHAGASVTVRDGRLLVGPAHVAERFRDQIVRLKGEILFSLDCCPVCVAALEYTHEQGEKGYYRLAWCSQDRSHCERATKLNLQTQ